jgi:hypothetical protein
LTTEAQKRNNSMFSRNDIAEICAVLKLVMDVDAMIELLRSECYLLLKGPKLYQLRAPS